MTPAGHHRLAQAAGLLLLALTGPSLAQAESRCWPEKVLIGQRAQAYVWGGATAAAEPVLTYTARGLPNAQLPCDAFTFLQATPGVVAATCSDETSFLPVEWSATAPGLARATLRSGGFAWLKPAQLGAVNAILAPGRSGTLLPVDAVIRTAPSLSSPVTRITVAAKKAWSAFVQAQSPIPALTLEQALVSRSGPFYVQRTAQKEVRNAQGTWMQLTQRLVYSNDGGISFQEGPAMASGYVLYRDQTGVVLTVLEDIACD